MKTKLCDLNPAAASRLPAHTDDKSGIGVHYVDAYLKPMNTKLPDGTAVKCKLNFSPNNSALTTEKTSMLIPES